jgi:hypothetical protein
MRSPPVLVPIVLRQANAFVAAYHRRHGPVVGQRFSIGAAQGGQLVGVVIVGRLVSRHRDDGLRLEVTRLCPDGTPNGCSFLHGAAARAAKALGYRRIGTSTLAEEPGDSLRAAGWTLVGIRGGGSWSKPSRGRADKHPTGLKVLWERTLA